MKSILIAISSFLFGFVASFLISSYVSREPEQDDAFAIYHSSETVKRDLTGDPSVSTIALKKDEIVLCKENGRNLYYDRPKNVGCGEDTEANLHWDKRSQEQIQAWLDQAR